MGFFDKIWKWVERAFNIVDHVVSVYQEIKEKLPGLIEFMEDLYDNFKPRVDDPNDPLTGEEAGVQLVDIVEKKFTNSPLSLPRSFIKYVLEVIHMYKNATSFSYYDKPGVRAQANSVLKGLKNKYGDR